MCILCLNMCYLHTFNICGLCREGKLDSMYLTLKKKIQVARLLQTYTTHFHPVVSTSTFIRAYTIIQYKKIEKSFFAIYIELKVDLFLQTFAISTLDNQQPSKKLMKLWKNVTYTDLKTHYSMLPLD